MPRRFRNLYEAKVMGAIPANEEEALLFQYARMEEEHETLEKIKSLADAIANQKRKGGAPRKTAGDTRLTERLVKKHEGNIKLARREFIQLVISSDPIEPKSARARFNAALKSLKT